MKKIVLAVAFTGFATNAFAGNPAPAVVEPDLAPIIESEAKGSSSGIIVPLVLLAVLIAAASD